MTDYFCECGNVHVGGPCCDACAAKVCHHCGHFRADHGPKLVPLCNDCEQCPGFEED